MSDRRSRHVAGAAIAWIALGVSLPLLLHDLLLGLESSADPRIIEAAGGIVAGSLAFGIAARFARGLERILPIATPVLLLCFLLLSIVTAWVHVPLSLAIRFALLAGAAPASFLSTKTVPLATTRETMIPITLGMLLAGSMWASREAYYWWIPAVTTGVLLAAAAAVAITALAGTRAALGPGPAAAPGSTGVPAMRAPGAAAAIALFLGTVPGLYMSLCKLVVENTAIDRPSTLAGAINAALIAGIVAAAIAAGGRGGAGRLASIVDGPAGLAGMLATTALAVGLPWILGTTRVIDDTTAGTWHLAGLVVVPLLGSYMLAKLAAIHAGPMYRALVPILGGLGFVTGIAGYLFGGSTYNMEFYIGAAFALLLGLGVMTAWACRPREATREVTTLATA